MYKSNFLNQHWVYVLLLQILLAMTLVSTNLKSACANAVTPEIPTVSDNENEFLMLQDEKDEYGDLYSYPWAKRPASNDGDLYADMMPVMVFFTNPAIMEELANSESDEMNDNNILNQKRGWKKMNVAWGKRRNGGQYMNRATGSWGKREPNWNNLKGMWGKRSVNNEMSHKRAASKGDQWNYLRGSWGKRSPQLAENN